MGATVTWRIDQGDCRELLRGMAAESVHIAITSPPYWGLRCYNTSPLVWEHADTLAYRAETGDDSALCEHAWGEEQPGRKRDEQHLEALGERLGCGGGNKASTVNHSHSGSGQFCAKCGAWLGSLGLENTPELYIAHMVEVFREVRRVMRKDATCWVNMGDNYATHLFTRQGKPRNVCQPPNDWEGTKLGGRESSKHVTVTHQTVPGLKPKDLCGMPWRLAFALQADGWWLRSEIIWHKPNPMPESVRDRPTKAHETVFLLTKAARYFYDNDAIREPHAEPGRIQKHYAHGYGTRNAVGIKTFKPSGESPGYNPAGRNRRTVWTIPTSAFPGAHFATFPPKLIEPMILTSPTKCCAVCGKGWVRETVRTDQVDPSANGSRFDTGKTAVHGNGRAQHGERHVTKALGFRPGCDCPGLDGDGPWIDLAAHPDGEANWPTVPAVVLDPFSGAGTTPMVALRHGRNAIGHELSEAYADMARRRIVADSPLFNHTGGCHDN
ncbi:hypothetical protein LCGC14_0785920 [marine sediment metagenome]|uniref:site-specific DNA-methyltransferase (cytosine-N(4)-specific) n=1 Tax=marine sediment metagenome TaxID=412755 RepID=A0A0F9PU82_9ZZZZ